MEKLAPVFAVHAKVARGLSHGIDLGLRGFAILSLGRGLIRVGAGERVTASNDFTAAYGAGVTGLGNITENISLRSAKVQGFVGEKVVGIVNKILHKTQKA